MSAWIDVEVVARSAAAVLIDNGKDQAWVPLSQVVDSEDDLVPGTHTKIELPDWLAEEKGLV